MAIPVHSLLNLNHKFNLSYLFHKQIKCISSFGKIAFSHIQDVAAPVLNCVQSHIILDHSITSPQAKDHIIPLGGQTLLYANKNYQYANKQFQSYLSKTEQDEELQFRVTAKPIFTILLCVSVQLVSPRPQPVLSGGHGEERLWLHRAGPSWLLGCHCDNMFNKGQNSCAAAVRENNEKKGHERKVIADTKVREEVEEEDWLQLPFPIPRSAFWRRRQKNQRKMSEFGPGKKRGRGKGASVLVLFLTILLFY